MRKASRRAAAVLALPTLVACNTLDPLGPIDVDNVSISLHVTGGIAGISRSVVVDGAEGQARVSCTGVTCEDAQSPLPLSDTQVSRLARSLEEAGILGLDGVDFGSACCDRFHADLSYERGFRHARVRGTFDLFPHDVLTALAPMEAFARGQVPVIFSPETRPSEWPRDPLTLHAAEAAEWSVALDLSWGGGCALHPIDLVLWGGFLESFPVQVNAHVAHEDNGDVCDAIVRETRRFDLRPLVAAYEDAYGPIGSERPTVILRITAPGASAPIDVEVQL